MSDSGRLILCSIQTKETLLVFLYPKYSGANRPPDGSQWCEASFSARCMSTVYCPCMEGEFLLLLWPRFSLPGTQGPAPLRAQRL